jgi:hypothetical protein
MAWHPRVGQGVARRYETRLTMCEPEACYSTTSCSCLSSCSSLLGGDFSNPFGSCVAVQKLTDLRATRFSTWILVSNLIDVSSQSGVMRLAPASSSLAVRSLGSLAFSTPVENVGVLNKIWYVHEHKTEEKTKFGACQGGQIPACEMKEHIDQPQRATQRFLVPYS